MGWKVGGVGALPVHFEVVSGVSGGLSLCFCVVGGDGNLRGSLESFAPVVEGSSLIFGDIDRFDIFYWDPAQLVPGIIGILETFLSGLGQLLNCECCFLLLMISFFLFF